MTEEPGIEEKAREIFGRLGNKRENLIPILQQIQEIYGYLPSPSMIEISHFLSIPEIDVYSVATFSVLERQCHHDQGGPHGFRRKQEGRG